MAYSGIVTKPVVLTDVSTLIGAGTTDLGTLCRSENINMWAKYKPFVATTPYVGKLFFDQDADSSKTDRDDALKSSHYGLYLSVPSGSRANTEGGYGSVWSMVSDAISSLLPTVTYQKPSGGSSSPFRLADFINYNHGASVPCWADTSTTLYPCSSEGNISLGIYVSEQLNDNLALHLKDLNFGTNVGDLYFGLLLFNSSKAFLAGTSTSISDMESSLYDMIGVDFKGIAGNNSYQINDGINGESFYTMPCLLTVKLDETLIMNARDSYLGTIYPLTFAKSTSYTRIRKYNSSTDKAIVITASCVCFATNSNTRDSVNGAQVRYNLYYLIYITRNSSGAAESMALNMTATLPSGTVVTIINNKSISIEGQSTWKNECSSAKYSIGWTEVASPNNTITSELINGSTIPFTIKVGTSFSYSGKIENGGSGSPCDP